MVLKKRLKKLLIIAMVVVTAVWAVALYLHIQAYNRAVQDSIKYPDLPQPIIAWQFGGYLVISGIAIFMAWVIVLAIPMHAEVKGG